MKAEVCILAITTLLIVGCNAKLIQYPDSGDPCIMINMDANFTLLSVTGAQKTDSSINEAVIGSGLCAGDNGTLASVDLVFATELKGSLALTFMKGADSTVTMDVTFSFDPDSIFKNNDKGTKIAADTGSTRLSKDSASYTCSADQDIPFKQVEGAVDQYQFKMVMSDVQIQAFNLNGGSFAPAEDCTDIAGTTEIPAPPTTQPPKPDNDTTTEPPAQPTTEPAPPKNETTTEPAPPNNDTTTEPPVQPTTEPVPPKNETSTEPPVQPTTEPVPPKNDTSTEPPAPPTTEAGTTLPPAPPTPVPGNPGTNTYNVEDENGTCILFKAGIEFKVPYQKNGGGNDTKTIGVPNGNMTKFSGNCKASNITQTLTLTFYDTWNMTMQFSLDASDYYLSEIELDADLNLELFPDIVKPGIVKVNQVFEKSQFSASKDGSYKCNDNTVVTLKNGYVMDTYNLQYAAFQGNITDFSSNGVSECPSDTDTNSVVPIAVGAALAGLVVIVLIAYLIGRKRSRQSGYEQV